MNKLQQPRNGLSGCRHGMLQCTCTLNDETPCRCDKCLGKLLDDMVAEGMLVKNEDGSYSVAEGFVDEQ